MSTPLVPDSASIFYLYPFNPKTHKPDRSKAVASKYLIVNGSNVVDPAVGGSDRFNLYGSLNPDGSINENSRFQNTHNYLIVPASYDVSEASAFAASVNADMHAASANGPARALAAAVTDMTKNFMPGGGQDLQRGQKWGVPEGDVAPAFKDAASWNLGYIAELTSIPNVFAEIGGGALNVWEYLHHIGHHKAPTLPYGMDEADAKNFQQGVRSASPPAKGALGEIYDNVIGIGHWLNESIAPVKRPPGRSYGPRRPANHTDNSGSTTSSAAAADFAHADQYMAEGAGALADAVVPHGALSSFHQIGGEALRMGGIDTSASGGTTRSHLGFPPLEHTDYGFGAIVATVAPYFRHLTGFSGASSAVGGMFQNVSLLGALMERDALPSIAPIGPRGRDEISPEQFASPFFDPAGLGERKNLATIEVADKKIDQLALRGALEELLERQGRLPPSGASAFDQMLTPAWPGLQVSG